ncbi:EAL domain-containing protein [Actinophytocola sp.]|uniref:EAL domain-containing protein n=1 Tax=Actinophytocola sp. TaxID=1872138 RepID=UPI003899BD53
MTSALSGGASTPEHDRTRDKLARKWAYLLCTTSYVPLIQTDLEQPMRELVDELFTALPGEGVTVAERVGVRLVELNCVDRKSLETTVDVLAAPLLAGGQPPERVARLLGGLAAGYADALRQRTVDQQESMVRAVKALAMKAASAAKAHQAAREAVATELTLLRRQLSHQLLHDVLTGLPNRQFFTTRLEEVLNSGTPVTLYRIELNGFAVLGDGLAGPCADTVLVEIATRLRSLVGGQDGMAARLDRAGFAVLHEHPPEEPGKRLPPAEFVRWLTEALAETTYVDDAGVALTANVGVVQSPPHGTNPVELLQVADIALRQAQAAGPGHWRLLERNEHKPARDTARLAAVMPGAVEMGELAVGYRLRVDLADRHPVSVEAYPRWDQAGLAGQSCVALAEETGLSPQIGRWLLRAASERLLAWTPDLPLSVRLSPNQSAAADLVDSVLDTLADLSVPPERLRLALPAAEVFDGRPRALDNLTTLAKAGVRMAVHDFRGNPSDVVRLPDLPLRTVLLAPRLVAQARAMGGETLVARAMSSLTRLVHEAGATVAVDDVRSEPEIDWWRRAGADIAGGPLFRVNPEAATG